MSIDDPSEQFATFGYCLIHAAHGSAVAYKDAQKTIDHAKANYAASDTVRAFHVYKTGLANDGEPRFAYAYYAVPVREGEAVQIVESSVLVERYERVSGRWQVMQKG